MKSRSLRFALFLPGVVLLLPVAGCVAPAEPNAGLAEASTAQHGQSHALRAPTGRDPKYTPDALKNAFSAACQKVGFRIRELAVDESGYPFLLYGVIEGERDLTPVQNAVSAMADYRYGGSWTQRRDGRTIFAMDITPGERNAATFARLRNLVGL